MANKSQRRRRRNNKSRRRRIKGGGKAQQWIDAFTTFQSLKDNENFQRVLDKITKETPRPTQEEFVVFLKDYPDFSGFKDKITAMTPDEYIDFIVVYPMAPDATFTASDDRRTMWKLNTTDKDYMFFKYF